MDDLASGSHGNYQGARSFNRVLKYITKEDPAPALYGITEAELSATTSQSGTLTGQIANLIRTGSTIRDLYSNEDIQPFLILHGRAVQAFHAQMANLQRSPQLTAPPEMIVPTSPCALQVHNWLLQNLGNLQRRLRSPQLWIKSPPGKGKSSLIAYLATLCQIYHFPHETWHDDFENDRHDLAVIDEFTGGHTLGHLNSWLDGSFLSLRQRNKAPLIKTHNIPTIILSNFHPTEVFHSAQLISLNAFLDRLTLVELSFEDDLFDLLPPLE